MSKIYRPRVIPNNWYLTKIKNLTNTGSGGTPLSTNKEFYENGMIPWINSGEIGQNRISRANKFITEKGKQNSNATLFPKESVLVALYGATAGKVSLLDIDATTNQAVCAIYPSKTFNSQFLKYYLDTLYSYLVDVSTGSARDNLSQKVIQELEIPLPDLQTQKSIAKVLHDLDAKIELNNKINQELETLSKAIYDYWFVQFNFPNEQGKPYKSSGGKMVYNKELRREIPVDWNSCRLGEVVERTGTGLNPRDNFILGEGSNYYVTIKNIEQSRIVLDEKCDRISDKSLETIDKRADLRKGDILFTSIEPVGTTYLLRKKPENWNINESVFTIRPNYKKVTSEFLYMFLSGNYIKTYTKNISTGSIHKGVRHSTLKECRLPLPKKEIVDFFSELISPVLNKIDILHQENNKITELRDWLLPMLMNGQVTKNEVKEQR